MNRPTAWPRARASTTPVSAPASPAWAAACMPRTSRSAAPTRTAPSACGRARAATAPICCAATWRPTASPRPPGRTAGDTGRWNSATRPAVLFLFGPYRPRPTWARPALLGAGIGELVCFLPLSPCGRGCRANKVSEAGEGSVLNAESGPLTRLALAIAPRDPPSPARGEGSEIAAPPTGRFPMPLSDTIKTLIRNAWDDGYPCLLATVGRQGPNITPKGSMIVYDDAHLAWWERSKHAVLENLGFEARVCVMYANFKAQRAGFGLPALLRQRRAARKRADTREDFQPAV